MKTQNKRRLQAELAIFWDEIAQYLPKSIERNALGDKKIFNAFAVAYPKIRKHIVSETIQAGVSVIVGEEKICSRMPRDESMCADCGVYNQALTTAATALQGLVDNK